nr:MAG TPA: hypothetical protein [Caudoviricetes sp.]
MCHPSGESEKRRRLNTLNIPHGSVKPDPIRSWSLPFDVEMGNNIGAITQSNLFGRIRDQSLEAAL